MADFNALEALINAHIKKNGVQAITGNILNGILRGMVAALGKGYTIAGSASPATDPGTMTGPLAYIAYTAGTYTHFGGLEVEQGEVAMLIYNEAEWHKEVLFSLAASATIDGNVGTPEVGVSFLDGQLTFDFRNMKGNPGDPAGFGTVNATVDDQIGTPSVSVQSSGPDTAKNFTFAFHNLKGETGVTSVVATVDNTSGTPSCAVSLQGQQLTLAFTGLKGAQGNTGVSADYPIAIINNLTTDDPASALSAAQGVVLDGKVSQLEAKVTDLEIFDFGAIPSSYWEIGAITITDSGWTYTINTNRVRTKDGVTIPLKAGTIIKFNSWTGKRFSVGWRLADGTYKRNANWVSADYVAPDDGEYVFVLAYDPDSTVVNASDLYGNFDVSSADDILKKVPALEENVYDKLISTKSSTNASGNLSTNVKMGYLYRVEISTEGTLDDNNSKVRFSDTSGETAAWSTLMFKITPGKPIYIPIYGNPTYSSSLRVDFSFSSENHSIRVDIYQLPLFKMGLEKSLVALTYTHPVVGTLSFDFVQGEWTSLDETNGSSQWCSIGWQFNRGRRIKLTYSANYVAFFRGVIFDQETNTFVATGSNTIPSSGIVYETSNWFIWSVQIRRADYARLTPDDAATAITINDMGGELYAKDVTALDSYYFTSKTEKRVSALETDVQRNFRLNMSEHGGILHHLSVEAVNPEVPSQSLFDIAFAKMLGNRFIEANVKTCSDGVFVTKHGGSDNSLGEGLLFAEGSGITKDTLFSEVSSTDLRQYVTYNAVLPKFRGHIPTLDEFCAECARQGITAFLRGATAESLAIARKYLPDERIIIEGIPRGDFRGMMTIFGTLTDADEILDVCERYGPPFYYAVSSMPDAPDNVVDSIVSKLHENGYMVAGAYLSAQRYQYLQGRGIDVIGSTHNANIPAFYIGKDLNVVGCDDENISLVGASYDSTAKTITMGIGDTLSVSSPALEDNVSKLCLRIMFEGTIDIAFGSNPTTSQTFTDFQSDGEREAVISLALFRKHSPILTITAKSATTIKDIAVCGSVVIKC